MVWAAIGLIVLIVGVGAFVLVGALRGLSEANTDGWSPAEAVIGRKVRSKKRGDGA